MLNNEWPVKKFSFIIFDDRHAHKLTNQYQIIPSIIIIVAPQRRSYHTNVCQLRTNFIGNICKFYMAACLDTIVAQQITSWWQGVISRGNSPPYKQVKVSITVIVTGYHA